jgi:hypothetical protein
MLTPITLLRVQCSLSVCLVGRLFRRIGLEQARVLPLRALVTGPRCLTQQVMADATVSGIAAIPAEHLPQPALRHYHTVTRGLLEQAPGDVLDLLPVTQARAVE